MGRACCIGISFPSEVRLPAGTKEDRCKLSHGNDLTDLSQAFETTPQEMHVDSWILSVSAAQT